jgi:hypothetical protein
MSKRVPVTNRRNQDRRGIDAILGDPASVAQGPPAVRPKLEKVTLYVRPDQVIQIEAIQLQERRRTGKRPDKSDLVQEALDLLIQKYGKTE